MISIHMLESGFEIDILFIRHNPDSFNIFYIASSIKLFG